MFEKWVLRKHRRSFAPPDEPAVREAFASQHGDLFVDIGANVGFYTLFLSTRFKKIYAIEADPVTVKKLYRRLKRRSILQGQIAGSASGARVTVFPYKLSNRDGTSAALNLRTYDTLFPHDTADLVKMDVEGDEFLVLEGMRLALKENRVRTIMVELHDSLRSNELTSLLESYGFRIERLDDHPRFIGHFEGEPNVLKE
jgi:FkbM family methyltransferase